MLGKGLPVVMGSSVQYSAHEGGRGGGGGGGFLGEAILKRASIGYWVDFDGMLG